MATQSTIANIEVSHVGRGRPVSEKTKTLRKRIINFLKKCEDVVTTNEVASGIKQSKQKVVAQMRWLEERGAVAKVGSAKVKSGRGRPSAMWKVMDEVAPTDTTKRTYVKGFKAFVRKVCAMTPEERNVLVHLSLIDLMERQLDDEKVSMESIYLNKQGFTSYDAPRGTMDAMKEKLTTADVNYWLNGRRLYKYVKQLSIEI